MTITQIIKEHAAAFVTVGKENTVGLLTVGSLGLAEIKEALGILMMIVTITYTLVKLKNEINSGKQRKRQQESSPEKKSRSGT